MKTGIQLSVKSALSASFTGGQRASIHLLYFLILEDQGGAGACLTLGEMV